MNWKLNSSLDCFTIMSRLTLVRPFFVSYSPASCKPLTGRKTALISPRFNKIFKNADSDPHTHSFPSLSLRICISNKDLPQGATMQRQDNPGNICLHRLRLVLDTMRWQLRQGRTLTIEEECSSSEKNATFAYTSPPFFSMQLKSHSNWLFPYWFEWLLNLILWIELVVWGMGEIR